VISKVWEFVNRKPDDDGRQAAKCGSGASADELARKNSSGRHQSCEGHWALFTPAPYYSRVSPHGGTHG